MICIRSFVSMFEYMETASVVTILALGGSGGKVSIILSRSWLFFFEPL